MATKKQLRLEERLKEKTEKERQVSETSVQIQAYIAAIENRLYIEHGKDYVYNFREGLEAMYRGLSMTNLSNEALDRAMNQYFEDEISNHEVKLPKPRAKTKEVYGIVYRGRNSKGVTRTVYGIIEPVQEQNIANAVITATKWIEKHLKKIKHPLARRTYQERTQEGIKTLVDALQNVGQGYYNLEKIGFDKISRESLKRSHNAAGYATKFKKHSGYMSHGK